MRVFSSPAAISIPAELIGTLPDGKRQAQQYKAVTSRTRFGRGGGGDGSFLINHTTNRCSTRTYSGRPSAVVSLLFVRPLARALQGGKNPLLWVFRSAVGRSGMAA